MEFNWIVLLYAFLLVDSIGAIGVAWFGSRWWIQLSGPFGKYFPPAKGWAVLYFLLVLAIGYLLGIFG